MINTVVTDVADGPDREGGGGRRREGAFKYYALIHGSSFFMIRSAYAYGIMI